MGKFFKAELQLIFITLLFAFFTTAVHAAVQISVSPSDVNENTATATLKFDDLVAGKDYYFTTVQDGSGNTTSLKGKTKADSTSISFDVCGAANNFLKTGCGDGDWFNGGKKYTAKISVEDGGTLKSLGEKSFTVTPFTPEIKISPTSPKPTDQLTVTITGSRRPAGNADRNKYSFNLKGKAPDGTSINTSNPGDVTVPPSGTVESKFGPLQNGDYTLEIKYSGRTIKTIALKIRDNGGSVDSNGGSGGVSTEPGVNLCAQNPGEVATTCKTALGDIPVDPVGLTQKVLSISLGLAGGIALIFMVYGSIKILISSGDPKKIGEGRDIIVAAVSGLIFLILSVLILKFIGISILPNNPFG